MKLIKKCTSLALAATLLAATALLASCSGDGKQPARETPTPKENEVTVSSVSLALEAENIMYISGDPFDPTGISLRVTYSDGTSKNITEGYTWDTEPLEAGDTSVIITYEGQTVTQDITVNDASDALLFYFGSGDRIRCFPRCGN